MFDIIATIIPAKSLTTGMRIIEPRFNSSNQRVEKSYQVASVSVGRFVHFTILDEGGETLRTFDPSTPVQMVGDAFEGEAY